MNKVKMLTVVPTTLAVQLMQKSVLRITILFHRLTRMLCG